MSTTTRRQTHWCKRSYYSVVITSILFIQDQSTPKLTKKPNRNRDRPTEQRNGTEQDQNDQWWRDEWTGYRGQGRRCTVGWRRGQAQPSDDRDQVDYIQAVGFALKSGFRTATTVIYKKYYRNSISRFELKPSEQLDIISIFVFYRLLKKFPLLFFSLYQPLLYLTLCTYIIDIFYLNFICKYLSYFQCLVHILISFAKSVV